MNERAEKLAESGPNPNFGQLSEMTSEQTTELAQPRPIPDSGQVSELKEIGQIGEECNRTESSNGRKYFKLRRYRTSELLRRTNDVSIGNSCNAVDVSNQKYMFHCLQILWLKQKRRMLYLPMDFGEIIY